MIKLFWNYEKSPYQQVSKLLPLLKAFPKKIVIWALIRIRIKMQKDFYRVIREIVGFLRYETSRKVDAFEAVF